MEGVCGARCTWTPENVRAALLRRVREQVGPTAHVVGAVSGGVDSTVAAALLQQAIGQRFHGESSSVVALRSAVRSFRCSFRHP